MKKQFSFSQEISGKGFFLIGLLIGTAVAAAMLLLSAFLLLKLDIDRAFAAPLATASVSAGTFAASFYNSYKLGDKGYLVGLLTGGAVFLVVLIASLMVTEKGFTINTIFHFVIMLLAGLTGGIWGVNRRINKKYI